MKSIKKLILINIICCMSLSISILLPMQHAHDSNDIEAPELMDEEQKAVPTYHTGRTGLTDVFTPTADQDIKSIALDIMSDDGVDQDFQNETEQQEAFTSLKKLYQGIVLGSSFQVTLLLKSELLKKRRFLRNWMHNISSQQYEELKTGFFQEYADELAGKAPCSLLWAAVEFAITSKQNREDKALYANRLEIIKSIVFYLPYDLRDMTRKPLRKNTPPPAYSWIFSLCCIPCHLMKSVVEGNVLHRAAQANNRDILEILLDAGFDINSLDSHGWTPLKYAQWFECTRARDFLRDRGAQEKSQCCVG